MLGIYTLSVIAHVLAAVVWVGGGVFISLVMVPVLRRPEHRAQAAPLLGAAGRRFRGVGWICLGVLLVTGVFNLWWRGYRWSDVAQGTIWQGSFGRPLAAKLVLVLVLVVLTFFHDFVLGPRAAAAAREDFGGAEALRLRRNASWAGRTGLAISLAVVLFAVIFVRGLF